MSLRIVALEPEHLAAVARFSERTWERPRTPEFARWRYVDPPGHRAFLALLGNECLAMLSVFSRPYRLGPESITCLETADWYCLPELRLSGLGIRLMRRAMEEPHPIVAVGGSADTLRLLPRLGWQCIGEATVFVLRLDGAMADLGFARRGGATALVRGLWAGLATGWLGLPRVPVPPGCEAVLVESPGPGLEALYSGPIPWGMVPLPVRDQLAWLGRGCRGSRRLATIYFRREGKLIGWSLLRLDAAGGGLEARLLDLFTPEADPKLCAWMVAAAIGHASAAGAASITAQASCPILQDALRRSRFVEKSRWPIHVWRLRSPLPSGPLHFCLNTGDAALLPYPSQ